MHVSGEELSDNGVATKAEADTSGNSLRFHSTNTNPHWFRNAVDVQKVNNVSIVHDLNEFENSLKPTDKAMLVK